MPKIVIELLTFLLSVTFSSALFAGDSITLYSARDASTIQPLLEQFTQNTEIQVKVVTGPAEQLIQSLLENDSNTAADIFIGMDATQLQQAKKIGALQSVTSELLTATVPMGYRDSEGFWYGLSMYVRPIFYAKKRVDPFEFYGYEEMTKPEWKGRICVSPSSNIYNQSLVASMLASRGKEATQKWLTEFVANLAQPAQGNDRDQFIAIAAGQCDMTLANTYLYGQMAASENKEEQRLVAGLGMLWANQPSRGVHANFSGAGMGIHAPHKDNAEKLLEFLLTEKSQLWFANHNYEYPVIDITWPGEIRRWGRFKSDSRNMPRLGELNQTAETMMKQAGWQ